MGKRSYKLQEFVAHASNVKCLNIGKKSCRTFVTGGEDKMVNMWAVGKPKCLLSLSGHTSPVESVTFDSSESLVLAGASSGIIKLWDLEDPNAVRTLSGHRSKCSSLEFHPFGEFLASGSTDADIKIWDARKKGCIHTYKGHTKGITTIRFTPDGRWLVSGGEDNVIKLWDLTAGKLLHDFKFHTGAIRSIDFHPHEFLLATGSADKTTRFWDLETFELIGSAGPEATSIRSMIFHPDGKTLFSGLEQKLKVFSWEPVRCHDDIDIGWSVLGDITIYEGKLLGCSYYENSVGVWVVDLSMIGPYATGGFSISSAFIEPEVKIMDDHNLSSVSSHPDDPDNQQIDTKEIIHTECRTFNLGDISQLSSGRAGSIKAPKGNQRGLAASKGKKDMSDNLGSQKSDKSYMMKPSKNVDPTDVKGGSGRTNGSNFFPKGTLTRSSSLSGNSISSNLKKDSILDKHRGINAQVNKMICTPVVVMRDIPDVPKSPKIHREFSLQETDVHDSRLYKLSHVQGSSSANVGNESHLVTTKHGSVGISSDDAHVALDTKGCPQPRGRNINSKVKNDDIKSPTVAFQRVSFLDSSFDFRREKDQESSPCISESDSAKCAKDQESCHRTSESNSANGVKASADDLESPCCTTKEKSVKFVRGVAVQHGRTRSLVESWEKRERFSDICKSEVDPSISMTPQTTDSSIPSKEPAPSPHEDPVSEDDAFANSILQSRDQFINVLKSRLTKLQMVRHCWEQNGIKGAINSVAKLPDLPVQVDVISILIEKTNLLTLEFFSSLLPILVGLLQSKTQRHVDISLEMLLKLVKLLWPVVLSTMSACSPVGVDIEAEERANRCRQIFSQFEKIREILPLLIRQGGIIARRSLELNLALQC